jgi:predicted phosphodiesterase
VLVAQADGEVNIRSIASRSVPIVNAVGRRVIFLSDLHLFANGISTSVGRVRALLSYLKSDRDAVIILGGDIYESKTISAAQIDVIAGRRLLPHESEQNRLLGDLHDYLRSRDFVLLSGNHDPHAWYESAHFVHDLCSVFSQEVLISTSSGIYLALHGHQIFEDHDVVTWGGIQNVRPAWVRMFFYYEAAGYFLFGDRFLRWMYGHINPRFRKSLESLRSAYSCDSVMLGHSHLGEINEQDRMYVSTLPRYGRIAALELGTDGLLEPRLIWYDPLSKNMHDLRSRLGLDENCQDHRS